MRALAIVVAASLALAACTEATKPKAGTESAFANVQEVTSPGGVKAWLVSEDFVPIISMEMAWQGGEAAAPEGKDGVGWIVGYMMNEGAGDLDTQAYGARMEELSMLYGCAVWTDWTACRMNTLAENKDEAFDMVRLAFAEQRLDPEPVDRAKREMVVELAQKETEPATIGARAMNAALMPGHPYSRYATAETVNSITREDIASLQKRLMTRDRLLVVVVGDITADELKPKLDEVFGVLPETSDLPAVEDVQPQPAPAEPIVKELPIPQTVILFSGPGVRRSDPDFYAAYVLNYILGGGGFSSRLVDDIREEKGLTYGIGTQLTIQPHFWRWTGSGSTKNENATEVVRLVKEHIAKLGSEGPTQKELDDAKAYLTGAFPLSFDSNMKIARNLMGFLQDGLDVGYVSERNDLINAVTMEDVRRVAAAYMKPENFTFVLVGQPK